MSSAENENQQPVIAGTTEDGRVVVVTPNGLAVEGPPRSADDGQQQPSEGEAQSGDDRQSVTEMVEQPAKVMRIGHMIRQLLDEVKSAPLDEPSRQRLRQIHTASIEELKQGLAPELAAELEKLSQPFASDATPTDAELRIAQAQLVGWLEGLFQGIQTALFAQQMAARAQLEQMRRALPGTVEQGPSGAPAPRVPGNDGMYL